MNTKDNLYKQIDSACQHEPLRRVLRSIVDAALQAEDVEQAETELPEPGHVWWRYNDTPRTDEPWNPGMWVTHNSLLDITGALVTVTDDIEILPANTIPPDATITKDELFRRIDEHGEANAACEGCGRELNWYDGTVYIVDCSECGLVTAACKQCSQVNVVCNRHHHEKESASTESGTAPRTDDSVYGERRKVVSKPTYARRWDDFSSKEQTAFSGYMSGKDRYEYLLRLATLPTLRNTSEFTEEELTELHNAYLDTPGGVSRSVRALAAKAIEIAKRST